MTIFRNISVEQANELLHQKHVLVLDTRDTQNYLQGHLPNALHLDSSNLRSLLKNTATDIPILIYCYHGVHSQEIAQLFADFGFTRCYSLDGGYAAWFQYIDQPWRPHGLASMAFV